MGTNATSVGAVKQELFTQLKARPFFDQTLGHPERWEFRWVPPGEKKNVREIYYHPQVTKKITYPYIAGPRPPRMEVYSWELHLRYYQNYTPDLVYQGENLLQEAINEVEAQLRDDPYVSHNVSNLAQVSDVKSQTIIWDAKTYLFEAVITLQVTNKVR
jgi:hypothetical protein